MEPVSRGNGEAIGSLKDSSIGTTLGKVSFYVLIAYVFIGGQIPFSANVTDINELATENIVNQIVFVFLLATSSLSLFYKRQLLLLVLKQEKFLSLFIAWCFVTLIWSSYEVISFKRVIQVYAIFSVCLSWLINVNSLSDCMKTIRSFLYVYISLCLVSVLFVPGAIDPNGCWRGLAAGKNELGQISLISLLVSFYSLRAGRLAATLGNTMLLLISITLLVGSQSMTPMVTLLLISFSGGLFRINRMTARQLGTGNWVIIFSAVLLIAAATSILWLNPNFYENFLDLLGKDSSFTGRTDLWLDIFNEAKKHWLLGCGFEGFWIIDSPTILALYQDYPWLPQQAHMGYLDVLNETGLIGLAILMMMATMFLRSSRKVKISNLWIWLFLMVFVLNLQETTFFKPKRVTCLIFFLSYLAPHVELVRQKIQKNRGF